VRLRRDLGVRVRRAGGVVLVVLGLGELLARGATVPDGALPPSGYPMDSAIVLHGNPWLLWELLPGTREELGVRVHVNTRGFRGPEIGPKQGPRALTLGDSSIYGFGVEDDEVWSARLGTTLDVEIVNGAVPGYSTFQALNLLQMRGLALEPEVLFVGTLWSDNNFDGFVDRELLATYAGWEATPARVVRAVLERSQLFRWLDWRLRVAPRAAAARKVGWDLSANDRPDGRRRVSIGDYAANLDRIAGVARSRGAAVVYLLPANRDAIDPRGSDPAWTPYRQVLREAAARHGALLVDVPAVFQASGHTSDALFLDKMHPTALGHAFMAEATAKALATRGWPTTKMAPAVDAAAAALPVDRWAHHVVPGNTTAPH
jgi:lysophospholipase L1-like esterase